MAVYRVPLGAPPPLSGHDHLWLWGVPPGRGDVVIVIGDAREPCDGFRARELALVMPDDPWAMPYQRGRHLWICREPTRPLDEPWAAARRYI